LKVFVACTNSSVIDCRGCASRKDFLTTKVAKDTKTREGVESGKTFFSFVLFVCFVVQILTFWLQLGRDRIQVMRREIQETVVRTASSKASPSERPELFSKWKE